MQRNENESFDAYKARRAVANEAVRNINRETRGGNQSARAKLRELSRGFHTGIKGMASSNRTQMGAGIAASAATKRATPARLRSHNAHLARAAERKNIRAAGNDAWLKAA